MVFSKLTGSLLLIAGTAIGAGMLGIPLATAGLGFFPALALLILTWFFSFLAGRILLAVALALPQENLHLNRMALFTLGRHGQWVSRFCVMGLLYALTVAYISGGGSLLQSALARYGVEVPTTLTQTLFTLVLSLFVITSTRATDHLNRVLMFAKAGLLGFFTLLCLPAVEPALLLHTELSPSLMGAALPVLFVSFGFHHIIPSLAQYHQFDEHALKKALLWGSLIPLIVYTLWILLSFGLTPLTGPESFAQFASTDIGVFISHLSAATQVSAVGIAIQLFANLALVTSFLGVSLGLFDFLGDTFSRSTDHTPHRIGLGLLTFAVPLGFASFYPNGFLQLLSYGGIFLAIMAFILPPLMALKLKICGKIAPFAVLLFGLLVVVLGLF